MWQIRRLDNQRLFSLEIYAVIAGTHRGVFPFGSKEKGTKRKEKGKHIRQTYSTVYYSVGVL